jgi:hypothetical protein
MTYEKGLFAQADPGIVSGSTIERKKMSTKTIYKRIALVAVAGMVSGLVSVAPVSAAVTAKAVTQPADYVGKVGVAINIPVYVTTTGVAVGGDTIVVTPTTSGATAAITATSLVVVGTNTTIPDAAGTTDWIVTATAAGSLTATAEATSGAVIAAPNNQLGTIIITPSRPGVTTVTLTTTGTAGGTAAARTFTITTPTLAYDAGDAAVASPYNTGTGVAGVANTVTIEATSDNTVRSLVTVSGAGATINTAAGSASIATDKLSTVLAAAATEIPVVVNTPTVGTVTVSLFKETASAGIFSATASNTVTITVSAAPALTAGGVNSATTTAALVAGATAGATVDGPVSASAAAGLSTAAAVIKVVLGQQSGAIAGTTAIAASIVGPGTLILDDTDGLASAISTGRSLTSTRALTGETFYVGVAPDGTSGVATVTITAGTYSVTKSVTFYGKVASLKATVKKNVANGTTATGALDVVAYDASNVVVPSQAITITSGTTATIASFSATSSSAAQVVAGTASVDVTAVALKFGAVVLTIKDSATGLVSTTATVNVGAAEAKAVTAAFSKASYAPGELVTLTISATDTNGVAVGDAAAVATSYTIITNSAVQGTIPTSAEFKLGKQVITFYAPLISGPLTADISLLATSAFATAIQGTTVKAATVVAQNVDISAITTLINSLIAKINALNKLVIKIQKKVKA